MTSSARAGLVLGARYELVEPIASGGMAQVWRGQDLSLTRPVAVKVLHSHLATDQAFVTRFRREALASAKLSHPSIVAVFDTLSDDGVEAIVMELVDGRTLRSVLDEVGVLPATDVVDIGVQISDALDVAHRAGVVHRDIKPANIMVGSDRRIMVTDFGIAKATKDDDLTHTGTLLGTAKYLAPEQVTGDPVDPRADIYALGVVLFEAATGQPPFQAETDAATALARLRQDVPRCRDHRADVPAALDQAIATAMARSPEHRYERASSFRATLAGLDLTRVGPVPADLSALPPPSGPGGPGGLDRSLDPPPPDPGSGGGNRADQGGRAPGRGSRKDRRRARRVGGRQRPTRTLAIGLIIGALLVAGLLLASLGGGGDASIDPADRLAVAEAVPFDPEGTVPYVELNDLAPRAVDGDPETIWRTEGYDGPALAGLKSGVGLVLTLDDRRDLNTIEVLVSSADWKAEVYVGDGEFGSNGQRFDPDAVGGPVAVLEGGERASASLEGTTGSRVLLWITETGVFENPEWGSRPYRFVLREVTLA
jgi:serine/threonine-protein kinase